MFSKRLRLTLLIGGIFLAPLILFSTRLAPWGAENQTIIVLGELAHPFARLWHEGYKGIESLWNGYVNLKLAAIENEQLKAENQALKVRLLDYNERSVELERLRQLAGFTSKLEDKFTVAEVIVGQKPSPFKTLRVAKGSKEGIEPGMPAITADGIVGRVVRCGLTMSDIQLIVDYDSNVDILIQRNRIRGVLNGFAMQEGRLHLQRGTEVRIGDTLITSGIVGSFPKGLPVGKIVKISFETDNVSQVITVEPWVDPRRVEEVIILLRQDPEIQRIVQTAGREWIQNTADSVLDSGG